MKIIVNAIFLSQELTGVQRFSMEISLCLKKVYGKHILFLSPVNILHKELAETLEVKTVGRSSGVIWEQVELPLYLLRHFPHSLLINLGSGAPVLYQCKISTIHDITFLRFPHTFKKKLYLLHKYLVPLIVKTSKKIFTVSEFSKREIIQTYKCTPDKVAVVYNAVNDSFKFQCNESKENFFLAVSSIKENKNFVSILYAYKKVHAKFPDFKLVIVGDLHSSAFNKISLQYLLEEGVECIGRISDEELQKWYNKAFCFLFPSYYEGFGIPVIEAQSCGCPVIAANTSSLPEICGDSVLYCNPYSVDDIAAQMECIIQQKDLYNELVKRGFENVARFSWDNSVKKIREVLSTCL